MKDCKNCYWTEKGPCRRYAKGQQITMFQDEEGTRCGKWVTREQWTGPLEAKAIAAADRSGETN